MSIQLISTNLATDLLTHKTQARPRYWRSLGKTAQTHKATTTDFNEKNRLWFIGALAFGTRLYLAAYYQLKRGSYLQGWCTLEQAELIFAQLEGNPFISELISLVEQRADLIALWQSTFPYRYFVSPGMVLKRWECSICGKQSTPGAPCGHIPSQVYAGELCYRRILECEPKEISIVTDPVQKYSVLQLEYDYSVVRYVLDGLTGPFHEWSGEWTYKRHPHNHFDDRPRNGPCPCKSKLRYSECCLRTPGVRLPHFQIKMTRGAGLRAPEDLIILHSKPSAPRE